MWGKDTVRERLTHRNRKTKTLTDLTMMKTSRTALSEMETEKQTQGRTNKGTSRHQRLSDK